MDIQIEFDSTFGDEKDTSGFSEVFKNSIGGTIESSIVLIAKSKSTDIEVTPVKRVQSEGFIYTGAKYKWSAGKLLFFNPDMGKYVASDKKPVHLNYTGATKNILGYTCKEAKSGDGDTVQVIAWICDKLSALINPAVPINGVKGAVFEYVEKGVKEIVIRKLEIL